MPVSGADHTDCRLCRNFVGFVVSKPPCVIFVIFIASFALAFLSLGYYVQHKALADEEASEEWNHMYSSLIPLSFCLQNYSKFHNGSHLLGSNEKKLVNVSLPFIFTVSIKPETAVWNSTTLFSSIPYFYLHLKDIHSHFKVYMWINIVGESSNKGSCSSTQNQNCDVKKYKSCVTLTLPRDVLPSKNPPRACNATQLSSSNAWPFIVIRPGKTDTKNEKELCGGLTKFSLERHPTYETEVFLSWEDKSKVNLRLQIASYILFVILLSFVLYAMIKGRPLKPILKKVLMT